MIDDGGTTVQLTENGSRAAAYAGAELNDEFRDFWRRIVRNFSHADEAGNRSHPYQVLLRLVGERPGITRAKCALALEANDDSEAELARIVDLSDLEESQILSAIGEKRTNWDNAKKILPSFAEQLEDVSKVGQCFYLAAGPGTGRATETIDQLGRELEQTRPSREVTPDSIARAGTADNFDEVQLPLAYTDPAVMEAAIRLRRTRLKRHNQLVREIAKNYSDGGLSLFEGRYDCLATSDLVGILNEVKTLDGSSSDEASQVRDCLGQLLYYEPFIKREFGEAVIHKVAVFESKVSDRHIELLEDQGIVVIWKEGSGFGGGYGADELLGRYFSELR